MKSKRIMLAGLVTVMAGSVAMGAVYTWDGGAGTLNWADANNWSGDIVPLVSDTAEILLGSNVVVNSSVSVKNTRVGSGTLTVQNGGTLTSSGSFDGMRVGRDGGAGTVTIDAGGTVDLGARNLYVTQSGTDVGTVNVSGTLTANQIFFSTTDTSGGAAFTMNAGSTVTLVAHLQTGNNGSTGHSITYNGGHLTVGSIARIAGTTMTINYDADGEIDFNGSFAIHADGAVRFNVNGAGNVMNLGAVAGDLNFATGSQIIVDMNNVAMAEGNYTLFSYATSLSELATLSVNNIASGLSASIVDTGTEYQLQVIPEPAVMGLIVASAVGLLFVKRQLSL